MEGEIVFNRFSNIYDAFSAFLAAMLIEKIEINSTDPKFQNSYNGQSSMILFSYCNEEASPELKQLLSHSVYSKLLNEDLKIPLDLLFSGSGCAGVKKYSSIQEGLEALRHMGVNPVIDRLNKILVNYAHVRIMYEKYTPDMGKTHLVKYVEDRIGFAPDSISADSGNWGMDTEKPKFEHKEKNITSNCGESSSTIYHIMLISRKN